MFTLDLEQLDILLKQSKRTAALDELQRTLREHPGPYEWQRVAETPWQSLVLRTRVSERIHSTTRARLASGDPDDRRSIREDFRLTVLGPSDATRTLDRLLPEIRRQALGFPGAFRAVGCNAAAGFTKKTAIFPPPGAIPGALGTLDRLRDAQPLADPIWNALLLYIFLLRTHPFSDGNGRTMRLLLSYELWRAGLIVDSVIPLKRVLDANRANEASLFTRISRHQMERDRVAQATADAMAFMARVLAIAAGTAGTRASQRAAS